MMFKKSKKQHCPRNPSLSSKKYSQIKPSKYIKLSDPLQSRKSIYKNKVQTCSTCNETFSWYTYDDHLCYCLEIIRRERISLPRKNGYINKSRIKPKIFGDKRQQPVLKKSKRQELKEIQKSTQKSRKCCTRKIQKKQKYQAIVPKPQITNEIIINIISEQDLINNNSIYSQQTMAPAQLQTSLSFNLQPFHPIPMQIFQQPMNIMINFPHDFEIPPLAHFHQSQLIEPFEENSLNDTLYPEMEETQERQVALQSPIFMELLRVQLEIQLQTLRIGSGYKQQGFTVQQFEERFPSEIHNSSNQTCTICISDFMKFQRTTTLSCKHQFHIQCIEEWLKKKRTCPMCRSNQT